MKKKMKKKMKVNRVERAANLLVSRFEIGMVD